MPQNIVTYMGVTHAFPAPPEGDEDQYTSDFLQYAQVTRSEDDYTDPTVVVLAIEHKHGTNFYASTTETGAIDQLEAFVDEWWEDSGLGEKPQNRIEKIAMYFEHNGDQESYVMDTTRVVG